MKENSYAKRLMFPKDQRLTLKNFHQEFFFLNSLALCCCAW